MSSMWSTELSCFKWIFWSLLFVNTSPVMYIYRCVVTYIRLCAHAYIYTHKHIKKNIYTYSFFPHTYTHRYLNTQQNKRTNLLHEYIHRRIFIKPHIYIYIYIIPFPLVLICSTIGAHNLSGGAPSKKAILLPWVSCKNLLKKEKKQVKNKQKKRVTRNKE